MPHVIPEAEEANAVLRGPYSQTVRPERQAVAMSMAQYQRRLHCRGRVSERGLTPT